MGDKPTLALQVLIAVLGAANVAFAAWLAYLARRNGKRPR